MAMGKRLVAYLADEARGLAKEFLEWCIAIAVLAAAAGVVLAFLWWRSAP